MKLKRAGIHTFTIYESSLGIGGTWWDNTYPGAEVDVGSHLYCFSFKSHAWTRTHARQPELQKYLEETVDEFGLRPHLRLGSRSSRPPGMMTATSGRSASTTAPYECHVLVSAVGFLNVPRYPDWPGLEAILGGPHFHTARWEHQHDLTGKVVAVVGTGSSATQVVPAIQPIVKQLYVFQREPGWVMPKGERDFSEAERAVLDRPWRSRRGALRASGTCSREPLGWAHDPAGHQVQRARRQQSLPRLHRPPVRRPSRPSRGVTPNTPFPASARSSPVPSIPLSRRTMWNWSRGPCTA